MFIDILMNNLPKVYESKPLKIDDCCFLETHPEMEGCCCKCKWHIKDCSHPYTNGGSIMVQRGWICIGFVMMEAEPSGFSEWSEHGLCELFIPLKESNNA